MDTELGQNEPTRFAWICDGLLIAGTLNDWAKMWEGDYYAGESDFNTTLITWGGDENTPPQFHKIVVKRGGLTDDDMIPYLFTVPGLHDVAHVSIDGRA